jgi:hypothetical protein
MHLHMPMLHFCNLRNMVNLPGCICWLEMGQLCRGVKESHIINRDYFSLPVVLITVNMSIVPPIMLLFVSFRVTVKC